MERLPVVAIVGRPNVGKSSLFNRLLGKKVSIVDNTSGVTRDRIVREAEIDDHKVVLIDTGGVDTEKTGFAIETTEQAKRAMEEADVVVFVVDRREGVTPLDEEVARILRKWGKPVIVVVNKVDEPFMEDAIYDAYKLGFPEVVPISTIHKIGIPTLKEKILEHLPEELRENAEKEFEKEKRREEVEKFISEENGEELQKLIETLEEGKNYTVEYEDREPIKVAIVGRPNVGKSTLLNALVGEKRAIVSEVPGTTRDAVDSYVKLGDDEFLFIDTAGIRRPGKVKDIEYYSYLRSLDAIDRADVVVLLVDGEEGPTDRDTKIAGIALRNFKPTIISVNKIDELQSQKDWERIHRELDYAFDFIPYAPRVFISAKEKKGINGLLKQVKELYKQYTKRVRTVEFNRVLAELMKAHQPPVYRNKIVRIYYGTQVKIKPPTFLLFSNYPEGVPKSFRRFLENRIREKFGFNKIPIRIVLKKR